MNAGWILRITFAWGISGGVMCWSQIAPAQSQFSQLPATASARIVAQPTAQYGTQPTQSSAQQAPQYTSQFQTANNQPTLPPTNASAFGQQGAQYAQPAAQNYQPSSSFAQQPRSSVFSTQPTVNDPRYSYQDPRVAAAPQLSPPENTVQQYTNQLNAAASQFSNTLRDAQQQAQQYGQQAQQYAQQAQQLGQTAQNWQQQAQQLGQQAQPFLSSLTNNPYAYVPPQQPQPDPQAQQYASSTQNDSQFGRSVLVNSPASNSQFGQGHGNLQSSSDSRFQNYQEQQQPSYQQPYYQQPQGNQHSNNQFIATSGQSAFTSSGQSNQAQDPRLMQTPTLNDPRYTQSQDPRATQDPRTTQNPRTLTLEPPLSATLPGNANQGANANSGQLASPYENVTAPRPDGQNNTGSNFAGNQSQPQNNSLTSFPSGTKTEVPSLFKDALPTSNNRLGNTSPYNSSPFGTPPGSNANSATTNPELPWTPLVASLLCLFASIGANFYFGWNFTEYYFRYRRLLVEGEEDDRQRMRDDERRR